MKKLRFKVNDTVTTKQDIKTLAITIPSNTIVKIIAVDHLMRCYDIQTADGQIITECSDDDFK